MPKSALPIRLQDPTNWTGTDDDVWYMRWRMGLKGLFAYGPRAKEWWAKWRRFPIILLKIKGEGFWRYESDTTNEEIALDITPYLSRIQYWTRWHLQIQWPFLIAFHIYFKKKDVMSCQQQGWQVNTTNKLLYMYFGAHRDGDVVYWFPSAFLGLTWK